MKFKKENGSIRQMQNRSFMGNFEQKRINYR